MESALGCIGIILLAAASVALGTLCAAFATLTGPWFWWKGLQAALDLDGPDDAGPASPRYLHWRAWTDLNKMLELGWEQMAKDTRSWMVGTWPPVGLGLRIGAGMGTLGVMAVMGGLHGLMLVIWGSVSLCVQWLLQGVEVVRTSVLGLTPPCHNCNRPYKLPIFICACGAEHPQLAPGRYGCWTHQCKCGRDLASVSWHQSAPLVAICPKPHCRQSVDPSRRLPICIAMAGGPSQGKTSVLIRAVDDLLHQRTVGGGWDMQPNQAADHQTFSSLKQQHERGKIDKTLTDVPRALNLRVSFHPSRPERLLYFYDPGGESFQRGGNLSQHPYYKFADGLVFVIDPFALQSVAGRHKNLLDRRQDELQPGDMCPVEAFTNFKNALWASQKLGLKSKCHLPLAIVISKMDAEGMLAAIGEMPGATTSDRCASFLEGAGLTDLVKDIRFLFPNHRFFCLGEFAEEEASIDAQRSGDAFAWVIKSRRLSWISGLIRWCGY